MTKPESKAPLVLAPLFSILLLFPAHAWEGHDWDLWLQSAKSEKPKIESPQAGLPALLPLMRSAGSDSPPIDSIQGWEKKRDRILGVLTQMLGEPGDLKPPKPEAETLGEEDMGAYLRRHIRIRSEPDDWIPAYLLLPKEPLAVSCPTMIVLHQTVAQGKEEPCGIRGSPELAIAAELVAHGYVCLVPDAIGFGERIPAGAQPYQSAADFYKKHPRWSFLGKMAWDVQREVDYLLTLKEVDPYRIGIIGHSHGGYGSIMSAIFEPRISAVVSSCGFTPLRFDPTPERWSHATALMPNLGFYLKDIASVPFDWHEIIACLAPRPFFDWSPTDDKGWPNTEKLKDVFEELKKVYGLYGAAESLTPSLGTGGHGFPKSVRDQAYLWLDSHLPPRPALKFDGLTAKDWEARRPAIKALLEHDTGPTDAPKLPIATRTMASKDQQGYTEQKLRYFVDANTPITAWLFLPKGVGGGKKSPALILFHQTVEQGKEEPAGHAGQASLQWGPELARRGYVVFMPDSICAGERITPSGAFDTRDFYRDFPKFSAMGKMIQDGRRAMDLVSSLREADPARIGVLGHSLGAEEALFVAAFDDRVKAAVASCGFAPFSAEHDPGRWARDHWFSYMPKLRIDLRAGRKPAWDFDDVIRLVAPRGYFNFESTEDNIFPEGKAIDPLIQYSAPLWKLYGAEGALKSRLAPGPHDLPADARAAAFDWLDSILKPSEKH